MCTYIYTPLLLQIHAGVLHASPECPIPVTLQDQL